MKPLLFALLLAGVCAQGQTQKAPAQQTSPSKSSVAAAGPYDPNHKIPPVGLNLTPEQTKQLAHLLPPPRTMGASKVVEKNQAGIEKIAGKDGYKKIHDWERANEPPTPPAK